MDPQALVQLFVQGGFAAVVLYIWWKDRQQIENLIEEIRKRDRFNEELMEKFREIAEGVFYLVRQSSRIEQKMADNFFCPIVRGFGQRGKDAYGNHDAQGKDSGGKKKA